MKYNNTPMNQNPVPSIFFIEVFHVAKAANEENKAIAIQEKYKLTSLTIEIP